MSKTREELVKELRRYGILSIDNEKIADFILARDRKIVEPLVKVEMTEYMDREDFLLALRKAKAETLKNSGVEL